MLLYRVLSLGLYCACNYDGDVVDRDFVSIQSLGCSECCNYDGSVIGREFVFTLGFNHPRDLQHMRKRGAFRLPFTYYYEP